MVRADLLHLSRLINAFLWRFESKSFFFFKLYVIPSDQVWRGVDPREGKEDTRLNFQTQMLLLINLIEWLFSFPLLLLPNTLIICFFLEYKKHPNVPSPFFRGWNTAWPLSELSEKTLWRGISVTKDHLISAHLIHQVKWLNTIWDGRMSKVCHLKIQAKCFHFRLNNGLT